ncbi:MAG: translation initiation factor IF-1 [Patescibacteria group bacterium]
MQARKKIETQKKDVKVQAKVIKTHSRGIFQVELDNGLKPLAYLSGKMKMNGIKVLPGDEVTVKLCPYDANMGIITFRKTK